MAGKLVEITMESQRHVAMLAVGHPTTLLTLNHGCIATTVLEEYSLFAALQSLTDLIQQQRGKRTVHHLAMLQVFNIDNLDLWKLNTFITLEKLNEAILTCLRVVICL